MHLKHSLFLSRMRQLMSVYCKQFPWMSRIMPTLHEIHVPRLVKYSQKSFFISERSSISDLILRLLVLKSLRSSSSSSRISSMLHPWKVWIKPFAQTLHLGESLYLYKHRSVGSTIQRGRHSGNCGLLISR